MVYQLRCPFSFYHCIIRGRQPLEQLSHQAAEPYQSSTGRQSARASRADADSHAQLPRLVVTASAVMLANNSGSFVSDQPAAANRSSACVFCGCAIDAVPGLTTCCCLPGMGPHPQVGLRSMLVHPTPHPRGALQLACRNQSLIGCLQVDIYLQQPCDEQPQPQQLLE